MESVKQKRYNFWSLPIGIVISIVLLSSWTLVLGQVQTVQIPAYSSAMVHSQYPEENFSGPVSAKYIAQTAISEGELFTKRTYFKIDLSAIPSNATIHSASLHLFGLSHNPSEETFHTLLTFPIQPWADSELNWFNQPEAPLENFITIPDAMYPNENAQIDFTDRVRNLIYFPSENPNYGFCMRLLEEEPIHKMSYYSENAEEQNLRPYLEVNYELPIDLVYNLSSELIEQEGEADNGSLTMAISQGNPPYSYTWSDGTNAIGSAASVEGLSTGIYFLTVTDNLNRSFTFEKGVGYDPGWRDDAVEQYAAFPQVVEKTSGYGWSEAVGSKSELKAGEDGWIEYKVEELKHKMFGFAEPNDYHLGYAKIDAGLYLREDRDLRRVVNGSEASIGTYNVGDMVRIEKNGERIDFFLNSELVNSYVYPEINEKTLLLSATAFRPNSRLTKLVISFKRAMEVRVYVENEAWFNSTDRKADGDIFALPRYGRKPYTYQWSNGATTDRIRNLTAGNYTITVTDANGQTASKVVTVHIDPDRDKNWEASKFYDENGNLVGASKSFTDYNGKATQGQSISTRTLNVFANQSGYDKYERPALNTLSAPTFHDRLDYQSNFFKASDGTLYSTNHFDKEDTPNQGGAYLGEVHEPYPVQNNVKGGLGWYYSDNNNVELRQDKTGYPYSRLIYAMHDPRQVVEFSAPHNTFAMGSGHEAKSYQVPVSGELIYFFGYGRGWDLESLTTINSATNGGIGTINGTDLTFDYEAVKTINIAPDGKESVLFHDTDGKLIAKALSGLNNAGVNEHTMDVVSTISGLVGRGERYVDIHLPEGCESSLSLTGWGVYDIYDLLTGEKVVSGLTNSSTSPVSPSPNLSSGLYRIEEIGTNGTCINCRPDVEVHYQLNYHNITLYYYDKKSQLISAVAPADFQFQTPTPAISSQTDYYDFDVFSSGTPGKTDDDWQFVQTSSKVFSKTHTPSTSIEDKFSNVTFFLTEDNVITQFPTYLISPSISPTTSTAAFGPHASGVNTNLSRPISTGPVDNDYEPNLITGPTYKEKYVFHFEVNAVDLSGIRHKASSVKLIAQKNLSDVWEFSTPDDQTITNPAYAASTVSVIDFQLSKLAADIEVDLVDIKKTRVEFTNDLDRPWIIHHEDVNYDIEDLRIQLEVKTHSISKPDHTISNANEYNTFGELISIRTTDEGKTEYVYTHDGLVRFAQTAQQRADGTFSYINYDQLGRPIQNGVVKATNGLNLRFQNHKNEYSLQSGQEAITQTAILEDIGKLRNVAGTLVAYTDLEEITSIIYDKPDPYFPASLLTYSAKNLRGRIAHVGNKNVATWYSYQSNGRIDWTVSQYHTWAGGTIKTMHYTYNRFGGVEKIIYQKDNPSDYFEHKYQYDEVGNLRRVYTRSANNIAYKEEAEYHYDLMGKLERVEVAQNLQGIDYTYNVLGMLKAINSPNIGKKNNTKYFVDPGRDGQNCVQQDIFGMSFDYFAGDYSRSGTKVSSGTAQRDFYNGEIAAIRWNSANHNTAVSDQQTSYDYDYTKEGWLASAFFTSVGPFGNNSVTPTTSTGAFGQYSLNNLSYGKNGNIKTLTRRGDGAAQLDMDDFTYRYDPDYPNRMVHLNDAIASNNYGTDLDDQGIWNVAVSGSWNNVYNASGQLIEDKQASLQYVYNSYGLINKIRKDHGNGYVDFVAFDYNEKGVRSRKISHDNLGNESKYTWYVTDPSGNKVAEYEQLVGQSTSSPTYPIMTTGRLGEYNRSNNTRVYEFTDHLGNVRATYSHNGFWGITIHSFADYYPYGSPLPGRQQVSSPGYGHGYQGQYTTKDEETGLDAFELRMWDSRLARWTATDPYKQFASPYLGMGNNPISGVDPDGGWSWTMAAVGAGVGAGIGYAATGEIEGAIGGALLGGVLVGSMFSGEISFGGSKTTLNTSEVRSVYGSTRSASDGIQFIGWGKAATSSTQFTSAFIDGYKGAGFINGKKNFKKFIEHQRNKSPVEIAAFQVKNPLGRRRYYIQQWRNIDSRKNNTANRSFNYPDDIPGYDRSDIIRQYHTHSTTNLGSPADAAYSWTLDRPVVPIGPKTPVLEIYFPQSGPKPNLSPPIMRGVGTPIKW